MPELPEVQTVVSELHRKLKNKKIKSVEVRKPKIVSIGPKTVSNIRKASEANAKQFAQLLAGQKITPIDHHPAPFRPLVCASHHCCTHHTLKHMHMTSAGSGSTARE
jgi:hypothetical protein